MVKAPKKVPLKTKIKRKLNSIKKYLGCRILLPWIYNWYSKKPVDEKLVLFADFRDRPMEDNFLGLWHLCNERGYQCVEFSGRVYGKECPPKDRYINKFKFRCTFMKLYAQAKVVFLVDYFDLAYLVKLRPETQLVQLWHACGLMKTMGYSASAKNWGASEKDRKRYPMHFNYTLACVSSENIRWAYQQAYRCKMENVKAIGIARTDVYFDEEFKKTARQELLKVFPEIGDRKIILYAPTYRGKHLKDAYLKRMIDYDVFNEALGEQYALVVKFHPLLVKGKLTELDRLSNLGFLFDASGIVTPEIALCAADILIGDYSSISFEYLLLERPVISYIYDINEYAGGRGLFDKYENLLPGPYVVTQQALLNKLLTVDEWFDIERIRKYKKYFMSACDGKSTERIYNYVFDPEYRKKYDEEYLRLHDPNDPDTISPQR